MDKRMEGNSALQIYRNGYSYEKYNKEPKQFFYFLRNAIIKELENNGFCTLTEYLLEEQYNQYKWLDVVVCAVFYDIANGYKQNQLIDIDSDIKYREYIPYSPNIRWADCKFSECKYIQFTSTVLNRIQTARNDVRETYYKKREDNGIDTMSQIQANQSEEILAKARAEAQEITNNAQKQATKLINDAQKQASSILGSGKSVTVFTKDAVENDKNIAEEKAERLVKQYLASEQKRFKQECDESAAEIISEQLKDMQRLEMIHTEMCNKTNALQAAWIKALDDTIVNMETIKSDFYKHLRDWQVSLYPGKLEPLARSFIEFYRLINVDKLIREEIVFQNSKISNVANTSGASFFDTLPSESTITGLLKLNENLTKCLKRFESALNGINLYVYYPSAGTVFDEIWHVPEDEECNYINKKIAQYITPGIAKKSNDGGEDDVVIPAEVRVVE